MNEEAAHPLFRKVRVISGIKFAAYSLADSVAVAKAVHEKGGGQASHDQLAAFLGYKSTRNGSYLDRIASAKLFGLVEGQGVLTLANRALMILMPEYPERVRGELLDAFMAVPLFKAIYEEYKGKELPPEFGLKNALRTRFGVTPSRINDAYRSLMESADTAGLFDVRGSRTQLIMPTITAGLPRRTPPPDAEPEAEEPNRFGGGGGDGSPPRTPDELRSEYVSTLIGLLREKGGQGEIDTDLMQRIEKLLGVSSQ